MKDSAIRVKPCSENINMHSRLCSFFYWAYILKCQLYVCFMMLFTNPVNATHGICTDMHAVVKLLIGSFFKCMTYEDN